MSAGAIEGVGRGGGLGGSPAARAAGREDQRPGAVALVDLGVRVEPIDGIITRAREVDAGSRHAQEARAVRPRTARELLGASGERCPAGVVDERVLADGKGKSVSIRRAISAVELPAWVALLPPDLLPR